MIDFLAIISSIILLIIKVIFGIIIWIYLVANYPGWVVVISFFVICYYLIRELCKILKMILG